MNNTDIAKFKATSEWMAVKYDEMNKRLFNGRLGKCDFAIFTTGKGSQGRTLGRFKLTAPHLKYNRRTRRLYREDGFYGDQVFINSDNFYNLCQPQILLNGNYSGTEQSLLATLVDEMCHYYTYMDGFCPTQGHGYEFRSISALVAERSEGEFTIQRLATAEEMAGYELDKEIQAKNDKRVQNRKSRSIAVFVKKTTGELELSVTSSTDLVREITRRNTDKPDVAYVAESNDQNLIDTLVDNGYKKIFRTYRYWTIDPSRIFGTDDFLQNYEHNILYSNENMDESTSAEKYTDLLEGIVNEYVDDVVNERFGDITPDMELGEYSPIEIS